ncbi:MAG TPA: di-heme oxidoredictase family protein, partial [Burkholderiaceae bacterium]|nr:di-heme oxidoredictase family protein [Burkholderiaceae bacterium]
ARSADYAAASGPRYLSINNAFGCPWIANAPGGLHGDGSVTVVDPNGEPLDNAPSNTAGGVFAGRMTDRERTPKAQPSSWIAKALNYRASGQLTPGSLAHGALGTAFLGPSPDGSGLAVFAVVTSDGAVAQVHVQDGVDGLAAPGTVGRLYIDDDPGVIGIAFKWNPQRALYIADSARDRLVLLHLDDDRRHFTVGRTSAIMSPALKQPVDVAAALPEIGNPSFASHTTLAGGSDLYVANRGDGSLLRVSQDGYVLARARIEVPGLGALGRDRIRAIAVSADAQRVWLTLQGELPGFAGRDGALIEVSAFDASGPFSREQHVDAKVNPALLRAGEQAFQKEFTPETGLGPLFNARACLTCHPGPGGMSTSEDHFVRRVARMDTVTGRVTPIEHPNSPVARRHSTRDLGQSNAPSAAVPRQANVVSLRMPPALYTSGRLDEIPDIEIIAQAVSKGDGIKGRVHYVTSANGELRVGRYGWKAHIATLEEMVADAFANELGITSALAPHPHMGPLTQVEDDDGLVRAVTAYLRGLRLPGVGTLP